MLRRDHRVVAWTLLATATMAVVPVFAAGTLRGAPVPVADGVTDAPAVVTDQTPSTSPSPSPSPSPSESPIDPPSEEPVPPKPPVPTPSEPSPVPPEPDPSDPAPTGGPTSPAPTPTETPTPTPTPGGGPVPSTADGLSFDYDVSDGLAGPTGTCAVTAVPAPADDPAGSPGGSPGGSSGNTSGASVVGTIDTGTTTDPVAISCLTVTRYQHTGSQVRFSGEATQDGKPTTYAITVVDGRGDRPDTFRIETSTGFGGGGALTGGSLKVR